jgi:hypothetical protein
MAQALSILGQRWSLDHRLRDRSNSPLAQISRTPPSSQLKESIPDTKEDSPCCDVSDWL